MRTDKLLQEAKQHSASLVDIVWGYLKKLLQLWKLEFMGCLRIFSKLCMLLHNRKQQILQMHNYEQLTRREIESPLTRSLAPIRFAMYWKWKYWKQIYCVEVLTPSHQVGTRYWMNIEGIEIMTPWSFHLGSKFYQVKTTPEFPINWSEILSSPMQPFS